MNQDDPFSNIQFNRSTHSYSSIEEDNDILDSIPDDSIVVDDYKEYRFENLYFHNNIFYHYDGIQYRKLRINEDYRNHSKYVCARDEKNKLIRIYYAKFKRLYDLD